jgi:putative PIN family toxin of toxin-antitoxin system
VIGVTADSNIYISALHFGGIPRQFLIGAQRGRFRLDISMPIVLEFQRILRVKFSWTEAELQRQSALLSRITTTARPTQTIDAVPDDPDDNRVLECAVAANSRYVVTGDNHLLRLGSFAGIQIIKVADFMGLLPS